MIVSFWHTITRNDEEFDVLVEYEASKHFGDVDLDILSVTNVDGVEIDTTEAEDREIIALCFDRVYEDWEDEKANYGDYRYDLSREYE